MRSSRILRQRLQFNVRSWPFYKALRTFGHGHLEQPLCVLPRAALQREFGGIEIRLADLRLLPSLIRIIGGAQNLLRRRRAEKEIDDGSRPFRHIELSCSLRQSARLFTTSGQKFAPQGRIGALWIEPPCLIKIAERFRK